MGSESPQGFDDNTLQTLLDDKEDIYEGDVDQEELNHILQADTDDIEPSHTFIEPSTTQLDELDFVAPYVPLPLLPQPKRKTISPVMLTQPLTKLCEQMQSPEFKREAGIPTVLAVTRFIAVGTTHGFVVIFDHNQDLRMILGGAAGTADFGPITAMDTAPLGVSMGKVEADWLVCGHQGGQVVVWDVASSKLLKTITDIHSSPVVHLRFLTDGRIISADTKGVVNLTQFNRVFLMLVAETQLVLNGSVGPILAMAPLLPGNAPHATDELNVVAFATSKKVHLIAAIPGQGVKIINSKLLKPDNAVGVPYLAWRRTINPRTSSGITVDSTLPADAKPLEPILAITWGTELQLLQAVNTAAVVTRVGQPVFDPRMLDFILVAQYSTDTPVTGLEWLGSQTLVLLNSRDELRVLDPFALSEVESANIKGMRLVYHQRLSPEPAFHGALRKSRGRIYLLGLGAIHTVHLLTWLERIEWLVGNSLWLDALALGLDFYEGRGKAVVGLPSEIVIVRDVTASKIAELLLQYVGVEVERTVGRVPADFPDHKRFGENYRDELLQIATVCIEYCLAIKSKELLFGELFTYFRASRVAWAFVEALEPYIVHDKLPHLYPEVMQDMVEHYNKQGLLPRVEQCVLHLDIMSLDFHQVITLCRKHRLFNALAYVYTKGMDDYVTPLDYMMGVLITSEGLPARRAGKHILLYLKHILAGEPFPPSAGAIPVNRLPSLKREVITFLLAKILDQEYPRLFHLLTFDAYETLQVLSVVFDDHTMASSVHQEIANVLINLMLDMEQEPFAPHGGQQLASRTGFNLLEQESLLFLLGKYYSKGSISIDKPMLLLIIGYLIFPPPPAVVLADDEDKKKRREEEELKEINRARKRQSLLLDVLRVSRPTDYNADKVLQLAEGNVWLYKVAQYIYSLKRNFSKVLLYHIKDPETRPHTYEFIRSLMMDPALSDDDKAAVKATTIANLAQLIAVDSVNTARLIIEVFNNEHEKILRELSTFPKQQYIYLKAIMENGSRKKESDSTVLSDLSRTASGSPAAPTREIRITPEVHELYVRHMCTFSPESIYPYLVSHDDYPLDACLKICQQFGITDATTYLLERTGDVSGALNMMLRTLNSRTESMLETYSTADNVGPQRSDIMLEVPPTSLKPEVPIFPFSQAERDVQDALSSAIALCQRNSQRLDDSENEMLWFRLLDVLVVFLRRTKHNGSKPVPINNAGWFNPNSKALPTQSPNPNQPATSSRDLASIRKSLTSLTHLVHTTLNNMMGHVAISSILAKIVNDHGTDEFGDFKSIIVGMLDTYAYETTILKTATHLLENDLFSATNTLVKNLTKAYAPISKLCCMCMRPLQHVIPPQPSTPAAQNQPQHRTSLNESVVLFHCSHAFHGPCLGKHIGCPLCTKEDKKEKSKATKRVKS